MNNEKMARHLCPEIAILYGYSLYLLDHAGACCALYNDARQAVKEFHGLSASFPLKSPQRCFCMEVRMAAINLARGIATNKKILNDKLRVAEEKREEMIIRMGRTERLAGTLRAGMRLAMLGGFAYAFFRAVISLPFLEEKFIGINEQFASVATALAVALIGSSLRALVTTRRTRRIFEDYDEATRHAHEEFTRAVTLQYKLAAETAEMAWKEMTDEPIPMTSGFKALLMGIVSGEKNGKLRNNPLSAQPHRSSHTVDAQPATHRFRHDPPVQCPASPLLRPSSL